MVKCLGSVVCVEFPLYVLAARYRIVQRAQSWSACHIIAWFQLSESVYTVYYVVL